MGLLDLHNGDILLKSGVWRPRAAFPCFPPGGIAVFNSAPVYAAVFMCALISALGGRADAAAVTGTVVNAETKKPVACRMYIRDRQGKWYFAESASPEGSAVHYSKQNWLNEESVEMHTSLSAHPFTVDLPPGEYEFTVERGKEYFTVTRSVKVGEEPVELRFELKRWIDMAERGWYSGETHVHRTLEELPPVQLAEDLNVSFPLLYWVHKAYKSPTAGQRSTRETVKPHVIDIDETHVIYPLNTEYEIGTVDGKRHMLGAFFVLNHESVFEKGVPPVRPIAEIAERGGGLLELDKHNWPWSMMLVPVMGIDLFELANNHMWRTEFAFKGFGEKPPEYMDVEKDEGGYTERGWIEYGFQNYYALLNCGFRLRPTAGTASGVHPVPLGFGRVYVKLTDGFSYDAWVEGLDAGRSFVTTGPMLFAEVNDRLPGHVFRHSKGASGEYAISGHVISSHPVQPIEIVVNGREVRRIRPTNARTDSGAYRSRIDAEVDVETSSWVVVRCFEERPGGRVRFAHTAPWHIEVSGRPLRPRAEEIDFLIDCMEKQIERNTGVLSEGAVGEYRRALEAYRAIAASVK